MGGGESCGKDTGKAAGGTMYSQEREREGTTTGR